MTPDKARVTILNRNCTMFTTTKELDEVAYRESLQPFIENRIALFVNSGGSGEANALTRTEVKRIYQIAVEVCKGKIPVMANMPEVRTVIEAIDWSGMAVECGVDVVNMYGPATLHGFRPNAYELNAYFDEVLRTIKAPVLLAPNPIQGYLPSAALIADVANRHTQVVGVNLVGITGDTYFLELRELLKRDLDLNVPLPGSLQSLTMGARGLICNLTNVIPKTVRQYVDLYEAGRYVEMSNVYADLERFSRYVETENWRGPRWQKMALKVLRLPGGEGGLRPPFQMPPADELQRFTAGLLKLGIPEIDALAKSAGLTP
jgi:dihydrodipicolinate synthase/N-acetylneuraminate lyase